MNKEPLTVEQVQDMIEEMNIMKTILNKNIVLLQEFLKNQENIR
ncbi:MULTISPECIES: hypothetical protein [Bacillus]|nr:MULTISPECIES: hypothetical protein [Bacillus]